MTPVSHTWRRGAENTPWRSLLPLPIALLAACAAAPPPRITLPADPAARLAAIEAREAQVRTLRARFSSVTHMPGDERSADGVLLVAKPDRFRLRLLLPFGITVFDYLNVGERSWMSLPLADTAQPDRADNFAPFSRDDLAQAFLRGAYAFPGRCTPTALPTGDVWVSCRDDGVVRRTLRIGAEGIVEETSFEADLARLSIRYADYREVDGIELPFHIRLDYPQRHQSVDITIDRYEVNRVLSDDLFQPPPGTPERARIDAAPLEGAAPAGRGTGTIVERQRTTYTGWICSQSQPRRRGALQGTLAPQG